MLTLPNPNYEVEGYLGPRGAHLYRIKKEGIVLADALPSVTKKLDIVGGAKTGALMGWAVKTAVNYARLEIDAAIADGRPLDMDLRTKILEAAKKRPERVKDDAADLGTRVHALIDRWIAGERNLDAREDEAIALKNFLNFVEQAGLEFMSGDLAVASKRLRYGGRLDAVAKAKRKIILLDWKTSNGIRDDYALQVAGYRIALEETYGIKADRAMVVRFDKADPNVLDYREVNLTQASKTWRALVKFESEYNGRFWK